MEKLKKYLWVSIRLAKIKITFAVMLSTLVGYIMQSGVFDIGPVLPVLGVFVLACGSAALNQYQEYREDAKMERTKHRPIPNGDISPRGALFISMIMITVGSVLLYFSSNFTALQLGLLTLIWYNGIYTKLKQKTAFAVVPGAVIGALPPIIGWAAAGGDIFNPVILVVAFFFFMWQIPHFWMLLLMHGKDYEKAGFKSLTRTYTEKQIQKITFVWIFATAVSALFLPFFGITQSPLADGVLLVFVVALIISSLRLLKPKEQIKLFRPFMQINVFLLGIMIILALEFTL